MFVTILDRNDNSPKFSQVSYTGSIMENSRPGTTVDMVSAYRQTTRATIIFTTHKKPTGKTRVELFRSETFSIECCETKPNQITVHC